MALDNTPKVISNSFEFEGHQGLLPSRGELLEEALQAFNISNFDFGNLVPRGVISPIDAFQIPQQLELETAYGLVTPQGNFLLYRPPLDCGCDCTSPEVIQPYNPLHRYLH